MLQATIAILRRMNAPSATQRISARRNVAPTILTRELETQRAISRLLLRRALCLRTLDTSDDNSLETRCAIDELARINRELETLNFFEMS